MSKKAGNDANEVREALTSQLEANGVRVVSGQNASKVLRAVATTGGSKKVAYNDQTRPGGGTSSLNVRSAIFALELHENGQWLWAVEGGGGGQAPGILMVEEGKTAQQALNSLNAASPEGFFMGVTLPKYIAQMPSTVYYGKSRFDNYGMVDDRVYERVPVEARRMGGAGYSGRPPVK